MKGANLILKQFHALLAKRFHHAVRSQKDFVAQVRSNGDRSQNLSTSLKNQTKSCRLSDRPSRQFRPHRFDLHHHRPPVWRVSQPDSDALDVRSAVHLLQVRHQHRPPAAIRANLRLFRTASSLFSNERPFDPKMKHFADSLLHGPGLGTRCMEGAPLG